MHINIFEKDIESISVRHHRFNKKNEERQHLKTTNNNWMYHAGKEEFAWPSNLQFLGLSGNSFSNEVFSSLSGIRHLKFLYIRRNQLKGSLDISG